MERGSGESGFRSLSDVNGIAWPYKIHLLETLIRCYHVFNVVTYLVMKSVATGSLDLYMFIASISPNA